jgi:ribosomal protein S19
MAGVAPNMERSTDARRQYIYEQTVRASLIRTNGQLARREKRAYSVIPSPIGDCPAVWKGEAWIDVADIAPVWIATQLAVQAPWALRTFLGTNLKQTGFAITYQRVAEGVWFPATYGTEFQIDALFFYKRTITLNLESSGFQKVTADSTIRYNDDAPSILGR